MVRRPYAGASALLKASIAATFVLGAAVAAAQTPDVYAEPAPAAAAAAAPDASFHDLICKPNGTEDGFDCADQATPAKIVPIPSQLDHVRPKDEPVSA